MKPYRIVEDKDGFPHMVTSGHILTEADLQSALAEMARMRNTATAKAGGRKCFVGWKNGAPLVVSDNPGPLGNLDVEIVPMQESR